MPQCEGKRKMSKAVTETVIAQALVNKRHRRLQLYSYQCSECRFYHLTKRPQVSKPTKVFNWAIRPQQEKP